MLKTPGIKGRAERIALHQKLNSLKRTLKANAMERDLQKKYWIASRRDDPQRLPK